MPGLYDDLAKPSGLYADLFSDDESGGESADVAAPLLQSAEKISDVAAGNKDSGIDRWLMQQEPLLNAGEHITQDLANPPKYLVNLPNRLAGQPDMPPLVSPEQGVKLAKFFSPVESSEGSAAQGVENFAGKLASGLTAPENIAGLMAGTKYPQLVGAIYQGMMAADLPGTIQRLRQAGSTSEQIEESLNALSTMGFMAAIQKHLQRPEPVPQVGRFMEPNEKLNLEQPTIEPPTEGTPNASNLPISKSVSELEVRPPVGESAPLRQQGETPGARPEEAAPAPAAGAGEILSGNRPVSETASAITAMTPQEWDTISKTYAGKISNGATGFGWDLGAEAKTPEDVAALKKLAEDLRKRFATEKTLGPRLNAAEEAYQAATGVNLKGEPALGLLRQKEPGYEPPVPHENALSADQERGGTAGPAPKASELKPDMATARAVAEMSPDEFVAKAGGFNRLNLELGRKATPEDLAELRQLHARANERAQAAMEKAVRPDATEEDKNNFVKLSSLPQFFNEAIAEATKAGVKETPPKAAPVKPAKINPEAQTPAKINQSKPSGFISPPVPERFETLEDVIKYRQAHKQAELDFYKSLGLGEQDAAKMWRASDARSNLDVESIERKLSPENLARLEKFSTGEGSEMYQFDRMFDPQDLVGKESKGEISTRLVGAMGKSEPLRPGLDDRFIFSVAALRALEKHGGTWSNVARALDEFTTRNSGSQSDKEFLFREVAAKIRKLAHEQGITLPEGELSGERGGPSIKQRASDDLAAKVEAGQVATKMAEAIRSQNQLPPPTVKESSTVPPPSEKAPALTAERAKVIADAEKALADMATEEEAMRQAASKVVQEGQRRMAPPPPANPGPQSLGILPPGSHYLQAAIDWVKSLPEKGNVMLAQLAGKAAPRTSLHSVESGNALVHYASAKIAGPVVARSMATDVLGEHHQDPAFGQKLGAVLVEDRLRAIRQGFIAAGDEAAAKEVETVVGKPWSPLRSNRAFHNALNDPEILAAIERHKATVQPAAQSAHAEAGGKLAGPGLNTGAFVNLKALFDDKEENLATGGRGNLENPLRRLSRFFREAKGTAQRYEIDYRTLAERMVTGNFEESAKRAMYSQLATDGLAEINDPGDPRPVLGGKPAVKFTIERRGVPSGDGRGRTYIKNLWVRSDIAPEVRQALNTDGAVGNAGLAAAANVINKIQLAGPTDAVWHTANMLGSIAGSQGGRTLLGDLARKMPGINILDAIGRTVASGIGVLRDNPDIQRQLAELAQIGALRGQHPAGLMGRMIQFVDRAGRLVRDDMYQNLVRRGLVENSEASRREWVNQMGQYNGRLMGQFQRFFKEAGFSPFIVAGRNFNRMAMRRLLLDPGTKASGPLAAMEMRGIEALGTVATLIAIPTLINFMINGNPSGRPGVKVGQIDTGKTDRDGNAIVIDPAQWTGLRRGLRISGAQAALEGARAGQGARRITRTMAHDILGGLMHPWTGPAVTAGSVAATGYDPRFYKESSNPKDVGANVTAALKQLNPVAAALLKAREKDTSAAGQLAMSLGGAAGIKAVHAQDNRAQLGQLHSTWMRKNPDPKIKADYERNSESDFAASAYAPLDAALRKNDQKAAVSEIQELLKTEGAKRLMARMQPKSTLFHEARSIEGQFYASLGPAQRLQYQAARREQIDLYRRFVKAWVQANKRP